MKFALWDDSNKKMDFRQSGSPFQTVKKPQFEKELSLRGAQPRTPGWLLLPFGQFTFWQSVPQNLTVL
ncbi:MAG: hypothetical protein IKU31_00960, partial [Oscillospiraceae bacterium]|nr:hypothetical protein [Oscillospiraceae bacterium]